MREWNKFRRHNFKISKSKVIGIDNFKPDIEVAKKFADKIDFLHCDCLDMKINGESIDVVLSNQVIEHIVKYEKYLSEIKKNTKKSGIINFVYTKFS